jgi:hypothetical protein
MQDAEVLLALAGIAGVFVGFGALISVRSEGAGGVYELTYIRGVVWMGLLVVVAAVFPVMLERYGITGRALWGPSSLIVLVLYWAMILVNNLMSEHRTLLAAARRRTLIANVVISTLLFDIPLNAALILVILGVLPEQEPALYVTAVAIVLLEAAFALLSLVYSQNRPQGA